MQSSFWKMMTQKKYELEYYEQYFRYNTMVDRIIKIFLAITSSSAIAGWLIWKEIEFVWAVMVAGSQLITAVNAYLPYNKRIKELNKLKTLLMPIYFKIEHQWFYVAEGLMSEIEINDLRYNFLGEWEEVEKSFFLDDSLPRKKRLWRKAEEFKDQYFNTLF